MSNQETKFQNSQNIHQPEPAISYCPAGEAFQIPNEKDYAQEFKRVKIHTQRTWISESD